MSEHFQSQIAGPFRLWEPLSYCLKDIILIQCWGVGAGSRDFLQGAGAVKPYLVEAGAREWGLF